MRTRTTIPALAGTALAIMALTATPSVAAGQSDLATVRAATAQYHDVNAALADGYVPASGCVPNMGFHYQRGIAATAGNLDPHAPEILVYAPKPNGDLKLVAVEYATWDDSAELFGMSFDAPHPAGGPPFHTLHAWIWQGNPAGTFTPTNPNIQC